mgnify:CR=1 FL=1
MYLSRIKLNTRMRKTQIALSNLEIIHAVIEKSLEHSDQKKRCLWRLDTLNGFLYLMIVSDSKPDLKVISSQLGYPEDEGESKNYDSFLDRMSVGQLWRFKITCNPTIARQDETGSRQRGKIYPVLKEEEQIKWFLRQADLNGFETDSKYLKLSQKHDYKFRKGNGKPNVQFLSLTFEGLLKIKDDKLFKDALTNGIGREKAYGQGLLTVMKA